MISGEPPFHNRNQEKKLEANIKCKLRFRHENFAACNSELLGFLQSLICADPEARASVEEALEHPWLHAVQNEIVRVTHKEFLNWMDSESGSSNPSLSRQQRNEHIAGMR
jgi:serine/threonine protein kinase